MSEFGRMEPLDEFNRALLENAHPRDWRNPAPAPRYNLVVVGAGTAGLVAAAGAAGLGARVALVERHLLGGDCLNVGCVPSKCLIRSARAAHDIRAAGQFGVRAPDDVQPDFSAAMARMRRLRSQISLHDSAQRFRDLGVDIFFGEGCFTGPRTLEVEGVQLRFSRAVIATGARAVRPSIPGLAEAGFLTNETVFSLTECPARLAVFGAGPLGCELAQAFQRLGSAVTIIERGPQFLSREDPDAAALLAESFQRDGVEVMLNTGIARIERAGAEKRLVLTRGGSEEILSVDEILVGAGRAPNVEGLGLEAAGVQFDAREGVKVNDFLQTTNPAIYACGDICLRHKFTHMADATARIVLRNALFFGRRRLSALTVPWCTYTDPEIAHVGLYEREAQERGIQVRTIVRRFSEVDRAVADGEEDGLLKIHLRAGTDTILGATLVARHAGEMMSELTLAMTAGIGLGRLRDVIHPYPTQAEVFRQAGDEYKRGRLTPRVKKLFERIMEWRRR